MSDENKEDSLTESLPPAVLFGKVNDAQGEVDVASVETVLCHYPMRSADLPGILVEVEHD